MQGWVGLWGSIFPTPAGFIPVYVRLGLVQAGSSLKPLPRLLPSCILSENSLMYQLNSMAKDCFISTDALDSSTESFPLKGRSLP